VAALHDASPVTEPVAHHLGGRHCHWPALLGDEVAAAIDVLLNLARAWSTVDPDGAMPYTDLAATFPSEVRQLLVWGLDNLDLVQPTTRLTSAQMKSRPSEHASFVIRELGRLGRPETASLLEPWVADPHLGDVAAAAIRQLRGSGPAEGRLDIG
jgi:hypothetical protein